MCYDMSYFSRTKLITDFLNIPEVGLLPFEPTYHQVAQSWCEWPVAIQHEKGIQLHLFEWGLIAPYMNSPEKIKKYRSSMANARSEKILNDKNSVWHRLQQQRCLVFSTGYFEHRDVGSKKKQAYFIRLKNEPIFCFAGLYNYAPTPDLETGELKGTFSIVTQPANSLMQKIHNSGENGNRMPMILTKELAMQWLDPALNQADLRKIMDYSVPEAALEAWPVASVRKRKDDDVNVIAPLEDANIPPL